MDLSADKDRATGPWAGPQAPCVIQAQSPCYLTTSKKSASRTRLLIPYLSVKLTDYSQVTDIKPAGQVHCNLENISSLSAQQQPSSAAALLRVQHCESVHKKTTVPPTQRKQHRRTINFATSIPRKLSVNRKGAKSTMKNDVKSTVKTCGFRSSKSTSLYYSMCKSVKISNHYLQITLSS